MSNITEEALAEFLGGTFLTELKRLTDEAIPDMSVRLNASPVGQARFTIKVTITAGPHKAPTMVADTTTACIYPPRKDKSVVEADDPDQSLIPGTSLAELNPQAAAVAVPKRRRKRGTPVA